MSSENQLQDREVPIDLMTSYEQEVFPKFQEGMKEAKQIRLVKYINPEEDDFALYCIVQQEEQVCLNGRLHPFLRRFKLKVYSVIKESQTEQRLNQRSAIFRATGVYVRSDTIILGGPGDDLSAPALTIEPS